MRDEKIENNEIEHFFYYLSIFICPNLWLCTPKNIFIFIINHFYILCEFAIINTTLINLQFRNILFYFIVKFYFIFFSWWFSNIYVFHFYLTFWVVLFFNLVMLLFIWIWRFGLCCHFLLICIITLFNQIGPISWTELFHWFFFLFFFCIIALFNQIGPISWTELFQWFVFLLVTCVSVSVSASASIRQILNNLY